MALKFSKSSIQVFTRNFFCIPTFVFMQLKVFARVQGKPQTWDEKDKIFVSLAYGYWKNGTEHVTLSRLPVGELLRLASFTLLCILFGLVALICVAYDSGNLCSSCAPKMSLLPCISS